MQQCFMIYHYHVPFVSAYWVSYLLTTVLLVIYLLLLYYHLLQCVLLIHLMSPAVTCILLISCIWRLHNSVCKHLLPQMVSIWRGCMLFQKHRYNAHRTHTKTQTMLKYYSSVLLDVQPVRHVPLISSLCFSFTIAD